MAINLFVRIKSDLELAELHRRLEERQPRFLEVPGLIQKIYGRDKQTGDACEATDVRREVYEVLFPLKPELGPLPALPPANTRQASQEKGVRPLFLLVG